MSDLRACTGCGRIQAFAMPVCRGCGGMQFAACPLPMEGTVYSHTTVHRAPSPELAALVPYTAVLVQASSNGLLLMRFKGDSPPAIGAVVQVGLQESVLVATQA